MESTQQETVSDMTLSHCDETQHNPLSQWLYEADLDDYKNGSLLYPLKDLEAGTHTIKLRVWDVYNNPSEALLSSRCG